MSSKGLPHPIERAHERYGARLTTDDVRGLEEQVRAKKAVCLHRTPEAELNLVMFDSNKDGRGIALAVYNLATKCIHTFLPKETAANARLRYRFMAQELESHPKASHIDGRALRKAYSAFARRSNARTKLQRQAAVNAYDED
jgi:hypothetical protein